MDPLLECSAELFDQSKRASGRRWKRYLLAEALKLDGARDRWEADLELRNRVDFARYTFRSVAAREAMLKTQGTVVA